MKVNNRIVQAEESKCDFCGKRITLGFIKRNNCNATCSRKAIYTRDSLNQEKKIRKEFRESYEAYRDYMRLQILTEPIIYYKEWESYLRQNNPPVEIQELIDHNVPLPKPNHEGYGLPKIEIKLKEKLIHV